MSVRAASSSDMAGLLAQADFGVLIRMLADEGYTVIGPRVEAEAVTYREIQHADELPAGWGSRQEGGRYRLERRRDDALFGYVQGVQSWRPHLFRPSRTLWRAQRTEEGFEFATPDESAPKLAFLGVRACEIAAIDLQDRVFSQGAAPDPDYKTRRESLFIVAVQCTEAGDTCFCTSMGTGPAVEWGYDLKLTELIDGDRHVFLVESGSSKGVALAAGLPLMSADDTDRESARTRTEQAAGAMGRSMETAGLKELIQENQEHSRWDAVAERCLACTNCTLVCPTCFCNTTEDVTSLDGQSTERRQRWDSCFTFDHSYLHGGSVRTTVAARYRQWMSHKLAHWIDQYGDSGCVGCGRCITWCPAAIDITEEAAALREAVEGGV